jgi:tetratricopeptide (TPR) repeat protein
VTNAYRRLFLGLCLAFAAMGPALAQSCEDRVSDYERRIELCAEAAAAAPDSAAAAIALGYKGEAERMLGRYDDAAVTLRQAIALVPTNAWNWTELGTVGLDSGDPTSALAMYSTALELYPEDSYTLGNRADAWRMLNEASRCQKDAEKAMLLDPADIFARLLNARCLTDLGRAEAALPHIDEVLAASPDWIDAYLAKITALMALGRHEEALALADQALDPAIFTTAGPEMLEVLAALRLSAQARLLPPDALLAEADRLAQTYPANAMITNVKVWSLLNAGRIAEAEAASPPLRALVGTTEMEGVYHDTLAQLDLAQGRTEAALTSFGHALRLEPALSRIYAKKLSEAGFLPLSNQPQNVIPALRRCVVAKGKECRVGA